MIFDGRHIDEIQDQEFESLVADHYSEWQSLEFKATYSTKNDDDKLEVLRDISSLANGGGGYLIVGIRDDGKGKAQKFEPILQLDAESIKKSVAGLCLDHVKERIDGLECAVRTINGNTIVVVRVPISDRIPHMISFKNATDFFTRYNDGKREMTIGEVREAFTQDFVGRRLARIEQNLTSLNESISLEKKKSSAREKIEQNVVPNISTLEDGAVLHDIARERFEKENGNTPCLWLAITPQNPRRNLINVDLEIVRDIFRNPPRQRSMGWNMTFDGQNPERTSEGINRGKKDFDYLELFSNGHMEFWKTLDLGFCWKQSEEEFKQRPRLYPIPVVEYPASFLRLFREIIDTIGLNDSYNFTCYFRFLKGYVLRPGMVGYWGYRDKDKLFAKDHFQLGEMKLTPDFNPDIAAFEAIKNLYLAYKYTVNDVPYFDPLKKEFNFNFKE